VVLDKKKKQAKASASDAEVISSDTGSDLPLSSPPSSASSSSSAAAAAAAAGGLLNLTARL